MFSRLQYISQGETPAIQLMNIRKALDAGCSWIQLRFKNAGESEILPLAVEVKKLCSVYKAVCVINDHPYIAKAVDADGLHLGLSDMPVNEAKTIIGDHKIIGGTANTLRDVLQRVDEGCSYVGLGPLRFTTTKAKLSPILGFPGYTSIMERLKLRGISVPLYAIGGVETNDIPELMRLGLYGIAVSGIITHYPDQKRLIEQCNNILDETINYSR